MPQNELQRLLPRHYQIIDLALGGNGSKEIAQAMGMSPQAVSLITNSPIFQNEIARRRAAIEKETNTQLATVPARAKQLLEDSSYLAAQTHVSIITKDDADYCEDPQVRQKSANSILDRVFGKGTEDQQKQQVVVLEAGAIQLLQLTMQECKQSLQAKISDQLPVDLVSESSIPMVEVPA